MNMFYRWIFDWVWGGLEAMPQQFMASYGWAGVAALAAGIYLAVKVARKAARPFAAVAILSAGAVAAWWFWPHQAHHDAPLPSVTQPSDARFASKAKASVQAKTAAMAKANTRNTRSKAALNGSQYLPGSYPLIMQDGTPALPPLWVPPVPTIRLPSFGGAHMLAAAPAHPVTASRSHTSATTKGASPASAPTAAATSATPKAQPNGLARATPPTATAQPSTKPDSRFAAKPSTQDKAASPTTGQVAAGSRQVHKPQPRADSPSTGGMGGSGMGMMQNPWPPSGQASQSAQYRRPRYMSTEQFAPQMTMDAYGNVQIGMSLHEQRQHMQQAGRPMGGGYGGQMPGNHMGGGYGGQMPGIHMGGVRRGR